MPSNHLKVGITGGIGAGKTLVCSVFGILGVPVYDADNRAKWLMNSDEELIVAIKRLFGEDSYQEGKLNRAHLSKAAFRQPELLKKLNGLVHPKVGEDYKEWVKANKNVHYSLKEAALLFESGSYKALDKVIQVSAPEELRMRRVLTRDPHRTEEDIRKIMDQQWNEQKKTALSDFVIKNDGTALVIPQVLRIHSTLLVR